MQIVGLPIENGGSFHSYEWKWDSGWWFGTMTLMTFHILGAIIPFDFHIFQWGSNQGFRFQAPPRTVNLVGNVLFLPTGLTF